MRRMIRDDDYDQNYDQDDDCDQKDDRDDDYDLVFNLNLYC